MAPAAPRAVFLLLLLGFLASLEMSWGLSCVPCEKVNCPEVDLSKCNVGHQRDAATCACCTKCSPDLDDPCGGPWRIHGTCGRGLTCNNNKADPQSKGVCVRKN